MDVDIVFTSDGKLSVVVDARDPFGSFQAGDILEFGQKGIFAVSESKHKSAAKDFIYDELRLQFLEANVRAHNQMVDEVFSGTLSEEELTKARETLKTAVVNINSGGFKDVAEKYAAGELADFTLHELARDVLAAVSDPGLQKEIMEGVLEYIREKRLALVPESLDTAYERLGLSPGTDDWSSPNDNDSGDGGNPPPDPGWNGGGGGWSSGVWGEPQTTGGQSDPRAVRIDSQSEEAGLRLSLRTAYF